MIFGFRFSQLKDGALKAPSGALLLPATALLQEHTEHLKNKYRHRAAPGAHGAFTYKKYVKLRPMVPQPRCQEDYGAPT